MNELKILLDDIKRRYHENNNMYNQWISEAIGKSNITKKSTQFCLNHATYFQGAMIENQIMIELIRNTIREARNES